MAGKPRPAGRVRSAHAGDEPTVRWITDAVFTVFGEYGSWLPGYLGHPGVWTFVYDEGDEVLGFAMLGVLDPEGRGEGRTGDMLAIAVRPGEQGRGIGTVLLERVVDKAARLRDVLDLAEVHLTVADTNEGARRLFARYGFEAMDGDHGRYEKGQRAIRLRLRL